MKIHFLCEFLWDISSGSKEFIKKTVPWLQKTKIKTPKNSRLSSFRVNFYEHINCIASTITFNCSAHKQYKHVYNFELPIHIPGQTNNHTCYILYDISKWYVSNLQWVFGIQLIVGGGR